MTKSSSPRPTKSVKIILVGDKAVGKSCILMRLAEQQFTSSHVSTMGIDFRQHILPSPHVLFKLQVWDSAGDDRYASLTRSYLTGAHIIAVVYDVSNPQSYDNVSKWVKDIEQWAQGPPEWNGKKPYICLVANKTDLIPAGSDSSVPSDCQRVKRDPRYELPVYNASAKDNTGIVSLFLSMTKTVSGGVQAVHEPLPTMTRSPSILREDTLTQSVSRLFARDTWLADNRPSLSLFKSCCRSPSSVPLPSPVKSVLPLFDQHYMSKGQQEVVRRMSV